MHIFAKILNDYFIKLIIIDIIGFSIIKKYTFVNIISNNLNFCTYSFLFYLFDLTSECNDYLVNIFWIIFGVNNSNIDIDINIK